MPRHVRAAADLIPPLSRCATLVRHRLRRISEGQVVAPEASPAKGASARMYRRLRQAQLVAELTHRRILAELDEEPR
jgi:hypothetical protein